MISDEPSTDRDCIDPGRPADLDATEAAQAILEYYRETCATRDRLGYVPALVATDAYDDLAVSRGGLIRYADQDPMVGPTVARPSVLLEGDVPRFHEYTRPTWRDASGWCEAVADQLVDAVEIAGETYCIDTDALADALREVAR